jgi:hypothetical protein
MSDQREIALAENRRRIIFGANRMYWLTSLIWHDYTFNFAVQIKYNHILKNTDELELSTLLDDISITVLQYDLSTLIMISDTLYDKIAEYYTTHDIQIDIVNLNQPVLSTTYTSKPL